MVGSAKVLRLLWGALLCSMVVLPWAASWALPATQPSPLTQGREHEAFGRGYLAYRSGQWARAADLLGVAAAADKTLGDYALYYRGRALTRGRFEERAAAAFARLVERFPQSVFFWDAYLRWAGLELNLGDAKRAQRLSAEVGAGAPSSQMRQAGLLVHARATLALGDFHRAYQEAQSIRQDYPRGPADPGARALANALLADHPALADTHSAAYAMGEAALLLREGLAPPALAFVWQALALKPAPAERAELLWFKALALRGDSAREAAALRQYLGVAPFGRHADGALERLAHLAWRRDRTQETRELLALLIRRFPRSPLAARAMLEIARTYEDDGKPVIAHARYATLLERYPEAGEISAEARFGLAWTLYSAGRFAEAARTFGQLKGRAQSPAERARYSYWQARALEKSGHRREASTVFRRLARRSETNYYPFLASLRLASGPDGLHLSASVLNAGALRPETTAAKPPPDAARALAPAAGFHLERVLALQGLGLSELLPRELAALEPYAEQKPAARIWLAAEFQAAKAYYQSVRFATRLAARGELDSVRAEPFRYPLAFPDLIDSASRENRLDPYLVFSLARQESLFNPRARSSADALGLMQLLPATARRVAREHHWPAPQDLLDPATNVRLATAYLRSLLQQFDGNPFCAVAAYNAGEQEVALWLSRFPGESDEWVENIRWHETRDYVKKVIGGVREYRLLYSGAAHPPPP